MPTFYTITVSGAPTTTITCTGIGAFISNADIVTVQTAGGTLPAPLAPSTSYYVVGITTNTLGLSLTSGGAAITLTTNGTGLNQLIDGWMQHFDATHGLSYTDINRLMDQDAVWADNVNANGKDLANTGNIYLAPGKTISGGSITLSLPFVNVSTCNFTAIAPGGSLTGGSPATITFAPVPTGINGADVGHWLYISAGTGTAEAALITGGTAVSGGASGTITFTPANNHTGAWTIASASGGLQEAVLALPSGTGTIVITPGSPCTLHAVVTFPTGAISIDGMDSTTNAIVRASDYPNGDLLYINHVFGNKYQLRNMQIANNTAAAQSSGAALHVALAQIFTTNLGIFGGYRGMILDGVPSSTFINTIMGGSGIAGRTESLIFLTAASGFVSTDLLFIGGQLFCQDTATYGFHMNAVDGIQIMGMAGGGGIGLFIDPPNSAPNYCASITMSLCELDNCVTAIMVAGAGGSTSCGGLNFSNNLLTSGSGATCIDLGVTHTGTIGGVVIEGNRIDAWSTPLALGTSVTQLVLHGNPGIDAVIPAVASAATLNFPVNPIFTLTGTTTVTTAAKLWAGREGTFIPTSGNVQFTAGASIGNTVVCLQNKPYAYVHDGTKLWINAPATQSAWTIPSFLNSWTDPANGNESPSYMLDSAGRVHLRGNIQAGTVTNTTVVFNVPAGFRPPKAVTVLAVQATTATPVEFYITTAGDVEVFGAAGMGGTLIWFSGSYSIL